jgi:hypothetical protein
MASDDPTSVPTPTKSEASAPAPPTASSLSQWLDSFKTTSSAVLLLGSFTAVLAVYVVQRGVLALFGAINVVDGQRQGNYDGLDFTYASVSIVAPLLLAFLCSLVAGLAESRQHVWALYAGAGGDRNVPPWTLGSTDEPSSTRLRSSFRWVGLLPPASIVIHLCAGLRIVQLGVAEWAPFDRDHQIQQPQNGAMVPEPATWIPVGIAMAVVSILSLRATWTFRRSLSQWRLERVAGPSGASINERNG